MMRPLGKLVVTVGALAILASPAWAQQEKQRRRGFGFNLGGVSFLMAPNVQKDLKLSEEQVAKVQDTLREIREKHRDDLAGLQDASREERQAKIEAYTKAVSDEAKKALSLSEEQAKRFDQISLQARGLQAFSDPKIAEKLKLTDDQKLKIREIAQSSRGAGGAFRKDASKEERAEALKKQGETRRENLAKVHALLTDDQKATWKELTGEPIEIRLQFPGRRNNNNN